MRFLILGRSVRLKKKKLKKKVHKKSRNSRPWYPRTMLKVNIHIFGLTKCTIVKNVHVFVPVFLYAVTILVFQIKRIISSKKWCNYIITFFFFENAKNLGRSDDGKGRKKRGWPNICKIICCIFQ